MASLNEAQRRHAAHYLEVLNQTDYLYIEGGESIERALEIFKQSWENIRIGQAWAARYFDSDDRAAEYCLAYPGAGTYLLDLYQHPLDSIKWHETALAAARKIHDREGEAAYLTNLGAAFHYLGEIDKAVECYEQSLVISREIGDRENEGNNLGNLGSAYADRGDFRRAITLYEQRLEIAREIRGSAW